MKRALIIGCGAIAGGYDLARPRDALPLTHAGAFTRDGRFELAACVDPDGTTRAGFAERWGVGRSAATLDQLDARSGDFDVISICSPTASHPEHLERAVALRPGVIFCEKPLAHDLAAAERLVARCEREGVALAVNYTRRWAPDLVALAAEVRAGAWGRLLSAVGWYGKGVIHNGGHMIDLLHMLTGDLRLNAVGPPLFDHDSQDPSVPALLQTSGGASVHLVATDTRAITQFELVLVCENGEIAMREGGRRIELRRPADSNVFAGHRELGARETRPGRYDEAMSRAAAEIAGFLAARPQSATPFASTGASALATQRLCEAIRIASFEHIKERPAT